MTSPITLTFNPYWVNIILPIFGALLIMILSFWLGTLQGKKQQKEDRYFSLSETALQNTVKVIVGEVIDSRNFATKKDLEKVEQEVRADISKVRDDIQELTKVLKNIPIIGSYLTRT